MNIEDNIFQKCEIDTNKLMEYGFIKHGKEYVYYQSILDNTFQVKIVIGSNKLTGKIFDVSFNEEYTNFRIESQNGEFVGKVRIAYENILIDIKKKCTKQLYFKKNQSNRISSLIEQKYMDFPEFIWEKFPGYGIFRNAKNNKWYGLIMNIPKCKLEPKSKDKQEIEILNVKLNPEEIIYLLKRKGFYRAYHMNKENWISIILDDTIKDDEIMQYINRSYNITEK